MSRHLAGVAIAAIVLVGCGDAQPSGPVVVGPSLRPGEFAIETISPPSGSTLDACPAALLTGELVRLEDGSLGVESPEKAYRVRWPTGWRGSIGPPVALVDESGVVIASVGEIVDVGGGDFGWWLGCGGVTVVE